MIESLLSSGLNLVFYLAVFAVMIGILVTSHEFGHFLAARSFGVRVLRFSTGFGPAVFAWYDRRGTEYCVGALPLGGYVLMQNGDEPHAADYPGESYNDASLFARLVICFAGPLANLLLAVLLQTALLAYGIPGAKPQLGQIEAHSVAAVAGLRSGDMVSRIGNSDIPTLSDMRLALLQQVGNTEPVSISVLRSDVTQSTVNLQLDLSGITELEPRQDPLEAIGVLAAVASKPLVGGILSASAADEAGFEAGDLILTGNNEPVDSWPQWTEMVRANPEVPMAVSVRRGSEVLNLSLTPARITDAGREIGRAGMAQGIDKALQTVRRVPLWQAPFYAVERVFDLTVLTTEAIWDLLTGQMSLENLSGPIGIAQISGQAAQISGVAFLTLMSLLSISLGVINLVPLPVLDGGRALLHLIEGAIRRPLPPRVEGVLNMIGILLISSLMLFTIVQDIGRL